MNQIKISSKLTQLELTQLELTQLELTQLRLEQSKLIPVELLGQRLDKILAIIFPQYSRVTLQNCIKVGGVLIDNKRILDPSKKIYNGNTLVLNYTEPAKLNEIAAEEIELDIVYEDDYILVINKQAGLVCHPAPGHYTGTLVNALMHKFKLSNINGNTRPGIVHRIDKDTSGLIIVAKTNEAHFALSKMFADHKKLINRKYICFVFGNPKSGKIETFIKRHPVNRQQFITDDKNGKLAITLYNTKQTRFFTPTKCISIVECKLLTGRTHQIRVHMKHLGCSLIGDSVYGKSKIESIYPEIVKTFPRQALHSAELSFQHPITNERLHFTSPLPQDMQGLYDLFTES